ncbi:MAG TPA: sensor histidine kinase [Rhodanobacteraceae bacterium]|jgi:signal transduction histidine kinase|nr:sensor histidine kinase [Rhodanobacteraceae bacterium]
MNDVKLNGPAADEASMRDQLARLREQQERLFAQLHAGEQHFKQLARSVWRVQEDERRRLARELHDGIGQQLTALRHRLDALAHSIEGATQASCPLQEALSICDSAIQETRALSRLLRPQVLDDLGLDAALSWLARHSAESGGFEVEVDAANAPPSIDGDLSTLIFRVAQEALANVLKHAHARHVVIRLAQRGEDWLQLLIVDDGRGFDVDAAFAKASGGDSTGLASMRERVRLFGGRFALVSQPGEGMQLRVLIPLLQGDGAT